jgi:hypothetical protein
MLTMMTMLTTICTITVSIITDTRKPTATAATSTSTVSYTTPWTMTTRMTSTTVNNKYFLGRIIIYTLWYDPRLKQETLAMEEEEKSEQEAFSDFAK